MITRQLGYQNNYVLQGGVNYWAETIMNPEVPPITSPNEEMAKYDLRKGAGMALGGAAEITQPAAAAVTGGVKPPIQKKQTKRKVAGGC